MVAFGSLPYSTLLANYMNLIETYCKAVSDTGKELTIDLEDNLTQSLFDRIKSVAMRYDVNCYAHPFGVLLKPNR